MLRPREGNLLPLRSARVRRCCHLAPPSSLIGKQNRHERRRRIPAQNYTSDAADLYFARIFLCGFPARQPAGAWRVDPSGALRSDSLLHKPSVVSLYKRRVHGLLMPAQSERGMARTHQSHAPAQSTLSFLISSCLLQTLGGNTLCFCTQTHIPPPPAWISQ